MQKTGSYFRCKFIFCVFIAILCTLQAADLQAESGSVAVVTNRFANVRSGPGTNYTRLGRVYEGNRFPVSAVLSEWVEISYKGKPAYIFSQLVNIEETGPSQSEVDRVELRVQDINNRLDRLMTKLEQATEIVDSRIPDQPEAEPVAVPMPEARRVVMPVERVSPAWVFIPGGPRLAAGDKLRGWGY